MTSTGKLGGNDAMHERALMTQQYVQAADAWLTANEALPLETMLSRARGLRERGHGNVISYSRKVFIPLTRLCRDTCAYCTFAAPPKTLSAPYLSPNEVLTIADSGRDAGCHEALFTLGDKPELRYQAARDALARLGFASTVDYLEAMCELVLKKTGLLPHVNAGVMTPAELDRLRQMSVSQGIMLESASDRLCERGGPHFGSPDKAPQVRLAMIAQAGELKIPFTSGILIGIGETRFERIEALFALRDLHERYGHIQEIIIQNFRAKPKTRMAAAREPGLQELMWTAAAARMIFGPHMNIQAPPNLSYDDFPALLQAGINDWGGVSPVTIDHVNPEAPWPDLKKLEHATRADGLQLLPRLAVYPEYVHDEVWIDPKVRPFLLPLTDANGFARDHDDWAPGLPVVLPQAARSQKKMVPNLERLFARAEAGTRLSEDEIVRLFSARDEDVQAICSAADRLRLRDSGSIVRYVVNRNINYTNVCTFKCGFCAFSKGKLSEQLRGAPYDLALEEVARRSREAWERGATEVCMQGGINPHYTGDTYLALLRAVKTETPKMHVHAFSPLEVSQGAASLGISVERFLVHLREAGLGSLPGTAAEILDDTVRAIICPDKLKTEEWLQVVASAHRVGLRTTATIMFGHIDQPIHWARHLLAIRNLQEQTGGFTEFVPLPYVHMEAPLFLRGRTRRGPTWREVRLMHAVARLVLSPLMANIQASWVKLGSDGVSALLRAGVNDLGGTLMNESISRAAGTQHGQELNPAAMEQLIRKAGRIPEQRTTLYDSVPEERKAASLSAAELAEPIQTPFNARRVSAVS